MENNKLITREYFNNEYLSEVTMIQDDEKNVWFKGADIARILGYSNREKAIRMHVEEDEKKKMNELMPAHRGPPLNSQPHTVFINESGLYSLILRSHLESAKLFKKWITKEVIPSLRKSGSYTVKKEIDCEKLREIQYKEIQILDSIKDSKLKQAFQDRLMNEITGEEQKPTQYARDIITIVKEEFNKNIDFMKAGVIGKMVLKKYKAKYHKSPQKYEKYVNGNNRMVNVYTKEEEPDLIQWITEYFLAK